MIKTLFGIVLSGLVMWAGPSILDPLKKSIHRIPDTNVPGDNPSILLLFMGMKRNFIPGLLRPWLLTNPGARDVDDDFPTQFGSIQLKQRHIAIILESPRTRISSNGQNVFFK